MDDDEDDSVFFVDQIADKRYNLSSTEYLVEWTGWPSTHNTWEPDVNIIDTDLIAVYEEKQKRKMMLPDFKNGQLQAIKESRMPGAPDQWMIPGFSDIDLRDFLNIELVERYLSTLNEATEVEENAIAVEEEVKIDVGTNTYKSKLRTAKSAQKVKQVKLGKKSVKKTTKKLKKSAAKSKVPAKKKKTGKALTRSG